MSTSSSSSDAGGVLRRRGDSSSTAPGSTAKIRGPDHGRDPLDRSSRLGIYLIFWWYYVNREMADYGRARGTKELGDSPTKSTPRSLPRRLHLVPASGRR